MELENSLRVIQRSSVLKSTVLDQEKSFGKRKKKISSENKGMQVGIINVNQWKELQE